MKWVLLVTGKTASKEIATLMQEYIKRISRFAELELIEVPVNHPSSIDQDTAKRKEKKLLENHIQHGDGVYLLDAKGKDHTSEGLAAWMDQARMSGKKRIVLVVGGAYGFDPDWDAICTGKLSLSKLTFTHQMVRLILLEQLYRGFSIIHGLPYHHAS